MPNAFRVVAAGSICLFLSLPSAAQQPRSPEAPPNEPIRLSPRPNPATTLVKTPAPFTRLFRNLERDAEQLFSPRNSFWFGVGGALSLAGRIEERELTARAASSKKMDTLFDAGEYIGGATFQFGAAVATYAIGHGIGSPRTQAAGADLIRAQILTQSITQGLKVAVGRTRPDGTHFSFPSGHSATTFATATVLERHFGWKAGVPAYAVATYVAASRLQENRHFASDVIFGATLGILAARAVSVEIGGARFDLSPVSSPHGGVGMGLTLLSP